VGLKENVILGHLVPAGTGFRSHQESEVRLNPAAVESLAAALAQAPPPPAEAPLEPAGTAEGGVLSPPALGQAFPPDLRPSSPTYRPRRNTSNHPYPPSPPPHRNA